jgi:putative transposase
MVRLVRALSTSYVMYFNQKYRRVGTLFQGAYKAAWVGQGNRGDTYLLHLSHYIHLNPRSEVRRSDPLSWSYSSYPYYLGQKVAVWLHLERVLSYFDQMNGASPPDIRAAYRRFVEQQDDPRGPIARLAID